MKKRDVKALADAWTNSQEIAKYPKQWGMSAHWQKEVLTDFAIFILKHNETFNDDINEKMSFELWKERNNWVAGKAHLFVQNNSWLTKTDRQLRKLWKESL